MNIADRDQDIVASRIRLETLASIGERHGITRERVRQLWDKTATAADKRKLLKAEVERDKDRAAARAKPNKIPMTRIHVLVPDAAGLDPDAVIAELADWADSLEAEKPPVTPRGGDRLDLYLPAALKVKISSWCALHGVNISDAVRYAASKSKSARTAK